MKKSKMLLAVLLALVLSMSVILTACKPEEEPAGTGEYTYRMGPSDLPTAWNIQTYESNSATYILDYTTDGLYAFDYNEDKTGYEIVPSMASAFPTDVTSQYVGQYGVKAGDENKVYSIPLKSNLKYDNGDPITAQSFVTSMQHLLNPEAANFRADNVYASGDLKIYGAELYLKQGKYSLFEIVSSAYGDGEYIDPASFQANNEGILQYTDPADGIVKDVVVDINSGGNWGSNGFADYAGAGYFDINELDTQGRIQFVNAAGDVLFYATVTTEIVTEGEGEAAEEIEVTVVTYTNAAGQEVTRNSEDGTWLLNGEVIKDEKGEPVKATAKTKVDDRYTALAAAADDKGLVKLTAELLKNVQDLIAVLQGFNNVEEYAAACAAQNPPKFKNGINYAYIEFEEMAFFGFNVTERPFEGNVGFFADAQGNLVIALVNPMAENFYLFYELCTSFFLVHNPTYERCESTSQGVYTNSYGTSVATYVGYGPYKLTTYSADSRIELEKNPHWHGFSEGEIKEGQYQTTKIVYQKVTDDATRLQMFLRGELDTYGLQAADMADYVGSEYIYYTDSESTWYLAMNPGLDNLQAVQSTASPVTQGNTVVKTVLAIDEFRQALSYSLNRQEFILQLSPTSGIATSLLSAMIVADPDSGQTYRSLDEAKDAILSFWGLADSWGPGKEYATRDEAIDSITGYDPSAAKVLFQTAYDKAVAAGYIPSGNNWEVQIVIGKPSDANFYNNGYEALKSTWTKAVEGTPFEGHLAFVQSQTLGSTTFGNYLKNGSVDILFGVGYGGSMFNPYAMMDCFTGSLQYDVFTDMSAKTLDIELDVGEGTKTYRASLYAWVSECLQGDEIIATVIGSDGQPTNEKQAIRAGSSDPASRRITILAAAEEAIMKISNIFPLMTDSTAALKGMRLNYATEEYIVGMGRGGIQYYTYSMDDAEWAAYVKAQPNGTLNYK